MTPVAAIDVGTNSVRLLVAEPGDDGVRTLTRQMQVTRLGAGVDATRKLDDAALARTVACIHAYARKASLLGAQRLRVAATSAVRDAADRERFFAAVRHATGVDAEVLSGEEEAATAFRGATASLDPPRPCLVLDIGGGSTEFILGVHAPAAMISRQLGCVRLHERCISHDPPTGAELEAAAGVVDAELDVVAEVVDVRGAASLVGVAGTVTTLAALHLGLPAYAPARIHGTRMPAARVADLTRQLALMTSRQRAQLGPMAPGREDVIVAGALILRRVLERFGFDGVVVSEADILDGLVLGLLEDASASLPPDRLDEVAARDDADHPLVVVDDGDA